MSRTFKDAPYKVRHPSNTDWIYTEAWSTRELPTTKAKKRKEVNTKDYCMSTPGWWIHLMMGKPERRSAHLLEKKALRVADIEEVDFPDTGRKPHIYFW